MRKPLYFLTSISLILFFLLGANFEAAAQRGKAIKPKSPAAPKQTDPEEQEYLDTLQAAKVYQLLADLQLSLASAYLENRAIGERDAKRALVKLDGEQRKNSSNLMTNYGQASGYLIWSNYLVKRNSFGKNPLSDKTIKASAETVRKALAKSLTIDPDYPQLFTIRAGLRGIDCYAGKFSSEQDCYYEPLEDFSRAMAFLPDEAETIVQRADLHKQFNRRALAESDEQTVKSLYDAFDAKIALNEKVTDTTPYFAERGEVETAYFLILIRLASDKDIKLQLSQNPAAAEAFRRKLSEYFERADKYFDDANEAAPSAAYLIKRGNLRFALSTVTLTVSANNSADNYREKLQEAVEFYTSALAIDAKNTEAYRQRAKVYRELGDLEAAEKDEKQSQILR